MNRRLQTLLLPLGLAVIATGCATFDDAVASVGDAELSPAEFEELLADAGVADDDFGNPARAVISAWIVEQAGPSDEETDALYDQGIEIAGVVCPSLIGTVDPAGAETAAERLEAGEVFEAVFNELNVAPDLAVNGGFVGCFPVEAFPAEALEQADVAALFAVNADNVAEAVDIGGQPTVVVFRRLDEIDPLTADEVRGLVAGQLLGSGLDTDLDITVDSRYGTFDPVSGTVIPLG